MATPSLLDRAIGDYRLVEFLGAGGMGEVYRAVHLKLGRSVAIKVLAADVQGPGFLDRFWNEARVHATLQHPNIATLYDFLEVDGRPCIVMEYVPGETLADLVRRCGRLPLGDTLRVAGDLACALAYVHERGIVHRDVKSSNVRLAADGTVKLLDFGIAKGGATPTITRAGSVIGTLPYLAPEQLQGEPATFRSDVWSFGIVLYEMLTGVVPFEGHTVGELLDRIRSAHFVPASVRCGAGSADPALRAVDGLVAGCLGRTPGERFASADAIVREVSRLRSAAYPAAGVPPGFEPTEPRPAGWFARHSAWLLAAAAVVLTIALAVALWSFRPAPGPMPPGQTPPGPAQAPPVVVSGQTELATYRIDVAEGSAEVFVNGRRVGRTPYDHRPKPGEETIELELRQPGFADVRETFDVTKKRVWTIAMPRTRD